MNLSNIVALILLNLAVFYEESIDKMADLPPAFAYYGSFQGVMQILKHQSLPLFKSEELRDPFLPNQSTLLNFDSQALFERAVKYMTSAILGKSAPKGSPNHPLQKAIIRWRGDNRFSNEDEIREALVGLLPAMVDKSFNHAKDLHAEWLAFIENKRLLPFFENATDSELWLLEAERYAGVVIKFKSAEGAIFERCVPVHYSKQPPKTVSLEDCVELMVGELNEIPVDFMRLLVTQNYQYRKQKEWRLIIERAPDDELCLNFPTELIQSIYIGAAVSKAKSEQMCLLVKKLSSKINIFHAKCSEKSYEFSFLKQNGLSDD